MRPPKVKKDRVISQLQSTATSGKPTITDLAKEHECTRQNIERIGKIAIEKGTLPPRDKWFTEPITQPTDDRIDLTQAIKQWTIILQAAGEASEQRDRVWRLENQLAATKSELERAKKERDEYKELSLQFRNAGRGVLHGD